MLLGLIVLIVGGFIAFYAITSSSTPRVAAPPKTERRPFQIISREVVPLPSEDVILWSFGRGPGGEQVRMMAHLPKDGSTKTFSVSAHDCSKDLQLVDWDSVPEIHVTDADALEICQPLG